MIVFKSSTCNRPENSEAGKQRCHKHNLENIMSNIVNTDANLLQILPGQNKRHVTVKIPCRRWVDFNSMKQNPSFEANILSRSRNSQLFMKSKGSLLHSQQISMSFIMRVIGPLSKSCCRMNLILIPIVQSIAYSI